jgi:hypothetical protein
MGQSRRHYKENHISLFPAYIRNPAIIKWHGHLHRQQNVRAYQCKNYPDLDLRKSGGRKERKSSTRYKNKNLTE